MGLLPRELSLSSSALTGLVTSPTEDDPYRYQVGFGNHHISEAVPGALPRNGTNLPQKCHLDLYAEHLNGTSFISSRDTVSNLWLYRVRPSVAHTPLRPSKPTSDIESCFLPTNPNVAFTPLGHTWGPLKAPASGEKITFMEGLKTVCGHGDPTLKEGLVVHQYLFNTNMDRQAYVNNDGDFLLVPQRGGLDIQTELGHLRVQPGAIAVIPASIRFAVRIVPGNFNPDSQDSSQIESVAAGYALEIFGTHFALPELGPIGANGLAHVRDFEYPVASFELDPPAASSEEASLVLPPWVITIKLAGKHYNYTQAHTPFDVVAWHGCYAPYKYDLSRFHHLTANTDQLDPTAYTVLTAPSKWPGVSLMDFCIFAEKWAVAQNTIRIPYHHRTMATELVGIIKGKYGGSVRDLEAGGLSFEQSYMPHGESYEAWMRARESEQGAMKVGEGFLGFMFHVSSHVGLTKWATERHPDIRMEVPGFWDSLQGHFVDNTAEINETLAAAGMPTLETTIRYGNPSPPLSVHNVE
ncbi:putative homogentisate 1,2-dioxygenase [Thozetella sp. PMI_491]|nr:putative homogentisate 1,2-dioxygenase [Thozetella sp. PMI_491]